MHKIQKLNSVVKSGLRFNYQQPYLGCPEVRATPERVWWLATALLDRERLGAFWRKIALF